MGSVSVAWTASLLLSALSPRSCEPPPPGDGGGEAGSNGGHTSHGGSSAGNSSIAGTTVGEGGSGGLSGAAGSSASGQGGIGAAAGVSGVAGSGGAVGGAAGVSGVAGSGGTVGIGGAAGASGIGGSSGSSGDVSPVLIVTELGLGAGDIRPLPFPATHCGSSPPGSQTFTITNPTSVTQNWTATLAQSFPFFSVSPPGSSLAPAQVVTVTITPLLIAAGSIPINVSSSMSGTITINGAQLGTPPIPVTELITGPFFSWSPANLDFGLVPVGSNPRLPLTLTFNGSGPVLGGDTHFSGSTLNPQAPSSWSVGLFDNTGGVDTGTLTWSSQSDQVYCTPHTFTATAVVFVAGTAGCANAFPATPCGDGQVCVSPTSCVTELALTGLPIAPGGSAFTGVLATGTAALADPLTASIAWGDQTVSAGTVVVPSPGFNEPFSVSGSHTYASAGTFQGAVTVTDSTNHFSKVASFAATN
jgi:hypothetical protein